MPQPTSSAQPDALRRYADMLASQSDQIAAEAQRLAAALGRLTATCREYPLGDISSLSDRAQSFGRRDAEIAGWVRGVAEAFIAADSTAAPPPPPATCAPVERPNYVVEAAQWVTSTAVGLARWRIAQEIRETQAMVAGGEAAVARAAATLASLQSQISQGAHTAAVGGHLVLDASVTIIDRVAWDMAARRLLASLRAIDNVTQRYDDTIFGAALGLDLMKGPLASSLLAISGLILLEGGPRWPSSAADSPKDVINLFEQDFWNLAFHKVSPALLLELAQEIEDLNRRTCDDLGTCANPRPASLTEENLSPQDAFPGAATDEATGELILPAASIMAGEHSAISSFNGEQISYRRIGEHENLLAICGLDMFNMGDENSPNGLSAVIQTAYDSDPMANPYYRLIRARFMAYLAQIPPGDTLNITGHSMGGGMTMLLLNDPEVQAAIIAGGYTLRSVVLYGAVRPMDVHRNGIPPTVPSELSSRVLAGTEVRIYIDPEDRLAMSVGAGHLTSDGLPMPNVHFIHDGEVSGAVEAHTSYANAEKYADLPADLQTLPFRVDPHSWRHKRSPDAGGAQLEEWLDSVGLTGAPLTSAVA